MNPSFAALHIRELLPSFFEATYKVRRAASISPLVSLTNDSRLYSQLRDKWIDLLHNSPSISTTDEHSTTSTLDNPSPESSESALVNLSQWMPRLTLDIIGLAGFGYSFNQVSGGSSDFADAFNSIFGNKEAVAGVLSPPSPAATVLVTIVVGLLIRLPLGLARWLPGKEVQDLLKAMDLIKAESRKVVQLKKAEVQKDGVGSLGSGRDLITLLCE
jgi:hypothetical protein